jgi:hypothetical protein
LLNILPEDMTFGGVFSAELSKIILLFANNVNTFSIIFCLVVRNILLFYSGQKRGFQLFFDKNRFEGVIREVGLSLADDLLFRNVTTKAGHADLI